MNMISFEPRIAIVDDKIEEVKGILENYQNIGAGIKYFNANLTSPDPKPEIHYSDLNLIFLDVHFTDNTSDYDATHCAGWIDSLVPENSFYILVIWSKETDKKDEILEELKKIEKYPFLVFTAQKTDFLITDGWDFDGLLSSINSKLEEYPELIELSNWKKNTTHASNLVIGHLVNDISPENLKMKLQKIILGHGGKSLLTSENNNFKREILFEALDSVLISNTKGLVSLEDIIQANNDNLYNIPESVQSEIDSKLNSWFHFKLLKEPLNQDQVRPGIISKFKEEGLRSNFGTMEDDLVKDFLKPQIKEKEKDGSLIQFEEIVLLLSRPCDISQDKYGRNLKLISGIAIVNPLRKENPRKEFKTGTKYDCIKLFDHLQLSSDKNDVALIFDYRYVFSVSKESYLEHFDNIKIFNKELLSEIQVEYGAYSSRLGITQII